MRPDPARLRIDKIIVHDVPRHSGNGDGGPRFSQIESTIDQNLRVFFQERIRTSLAAAAFEVMFDPAASSPVPELVLDQLGPQTKTYVDMSTELASHLYAIQTQVNSAGILAVIQGEIEGAPCLSVLKVEREAGVRLAEISQGGLRTFDILHVKDLMLTDKTKVFKAGLFVQTGSALDSMTGLVSDHQRGAMPRTAIATFFLSGFLGCQLRQAPDVTVRQFFHETQEFINRHVPDPELKTDYLAALISTMKSNVPILHPVQFAQDHLRGRDRQKLLDHLTEARIPIGQIDKDTSLIEGQLKRTRYEFESGLILTGPVDSFEQHVAFIKQDNGESKTEIRDKLSDVHAR